MFPDDVETITMTRQDYDRHLEELIYENVKLKKQNENLKKELSSVRAELIKLQILNKNGYISYGMRNG